MASESTRARQREVNVPSGGLLRVSLLRRADPATMATRRLMHAPGDHMRLEPSQPPLLDRCVIALLPVLWLVASCADPVPTSPGPTPQFDVAAEEVIIRDEEWADRTVDEAPVEMAPASAIVT